MTYFTPRYLIANVLDDLIGCHITKISAPARDAICSQFRNVPLASSRFFYRASLHWHQVALVFPPVKCPQCGHLLRYLWSQESQHFYRCLHHGLIVLRADRRLERDTQDLTISGRHLEPKQLS